jgi:type II secretory pathway pseudopilin PulG
MTYRRNKVRGFSLVELAVVLGTVAILATLSLSYLQSAISQSRDSEASLTLSAIERMMLDYYNTNGQYPASAPQEPPQPPAAGKQSWVDGQPGWTDIGFKSDGAAYLFRYSFQSTLDSTGKYSSCTLLAVGDLDNSGIPTPHTVLLQDGDIVDSN